MPIEMKNQSLPPSPVQTLLPYLKIFRRYIWLILILTLLPAAATLAYVIVSIRLPPEESPLPNVYQAGATLIVNAGSQSDSAATILGSMGSDKSAGAGLTKDNGGLILQIIRSRLLLDRLIEEFDLSSRYRIEKSVKASTRKAVLRNAQFLYEPSTGIFQIFYKDRDPSFARDVTNRFVSLLEEWFGSNYGQANLKQRQLLEAKLGEVKATIDGLQRKLKSLQKQYGVLNVDELGRAQAASLANLHSQLILKDVEIMNYSGYSSKDNPRLNQLQQERKNISDLIAQNQEKIPDYRTGSDGELSPDQNSKMSLPDVAQQFSQLTIALDIQQRIYNTLTPQYEAAKLLSTESYTPFKVLELAEVPDAKSGPQRSKLVIMALGGGLAAALALSLLIDALRKMRARKDEGANA